MHSLRSYHLCSILAFLLLFSGVAPAQTDNPSYDSTLATTLGADDYGMKSYVLVILKTGNNQSADRSFIDSCFSGHMQNMDRLVESGELIVAGPMGKNDHAYRGIFILNLASINDAREVLQSDPAIHAGLLDAELFNWYGSAALSLYLPSSDKIWKIKP